MPQVVTYVPRVQMQVRAQDTHIPEEPQEIEWLLRLRVFGLGFGVGGIVFTILNFGTSCVC